MRGEKIDNYTGIENIRSPLYLFLVNPFYFLAASSLSECMQIEYENHVLRNFISNK